MPTRMLAATLAVIAWLAPVASRAAESPKPNFVVILVDDMGYGDIGPFGSKLNRTPHLDRMAREGMKLTSFYAAPVCTPSRAQMMTGCYAKRVSLPNVIFPACPIGLSAKEHTVAELLKEQGYATMAIGKWHLGDQPEFLPTRHGFDHYLGLPYSNDMGGTAKRRGNAAAAAFAARRHRNRGARRSRHAHLRYTQEAVKFINTNSDRPFFLYLPHTAVHVPLHPGALQGQIGQWHLRRLGRGSGLECRPGAGHAARTQTSRADLRIVHQRQRPVADARQERRNRRAVARRQRHHLGRRHARADDRLVARSYRRRTVCDAVMSEIDVLPTLVKLAGGKVPTDRKIDGKDVWPLLAGQTTESPHEALFYFNGNRLEAVRSGPWKLAIAPQGTGLPKGAPSR